VTKTIEQIYEEAFKEIKSATDSESIKALSTRYLGRKGIITHFLRNISNLPLEKRPEVGKRANEVKKSLDKAFKHALKDFETEFLQKDYRDYRIDVSLPGRTIQQGSLHPITQITWQICEILEKIGFDIAEGPEVETDHYNFEALNIPKNHPARDMQDTFYISDNMIHELFEKASVVVLPYIDASQSGIIPLAYAYKKPVVVTNVGSLKEAVDDGETGYIVPPENSKKLAEAIIDLLKDDVGRKRMGKNAYNNTKNKFSWDHIAKKTIEIYKKI